MKKYLFIIAEQPLSETGLQLWPKQAPVELKKLHNVLPSGSRDE